MSTEVDGYEPVLLAASKLGCTVSAWGIIVLSSCTDVSGCCDRLETLLCTSTSGSSSELQPDCRSN